MAIYWTDATGKRKWRGVLEEAAALALVTLAVGFCVLGWLY